MWRLGKLNVHISIVLLMFCHFCTELIAIKQKFCFEKRVSHLIFIDLFTASGKNLSLNGNFSNYLLVFRFFMRFFYLFLFFLSFFCLCNVFYWSLLPFFCSFLPDSFKIFTLICFLCQTISDFSLNSPQFSHLIHKIQSFCECNFLQIDCLTQ